jgi:hypothetical protein
LVTAGPSNSPRQGDFELSLSPPGIPIVIAGQQISPGGA